MVSSGNLHMKNNLIPKSVFKAPDSIFVFLLCENCQGFSCFLGLQEYNFGVTRLKIRVSEKVTIDLSISATQWKVLEKQKLSQIAR